jgi:hypothetical protein
VGRTASLEVYFAFMATWHRHCATGFTCLLVLSVVGCGGTEPAASASASWQVAVESPGAALLSVNGTSADDVWLVGASDEDGPLVLHWDGQRWSRVPAPGIEADLWWVHALPGGVVFIAGSAGTVLEWRAGELSSLATPGVGGDTLFGVWAASETDVYAVGSRDGGNGFVWHYDGQGWATLPLPVDPALEEGGVAPGLFKVWGRSPEDVWLVGDRGLVLRGNAAAGFQQVSSGVAERLFTVHGSADRVVMVGGSSNALALEAYADAALTAITPPGAGLLQGVNLSEAGVLWAVGLGGGIYSRAAGAASWLEEFVVPVQSLHAVWADPDGGVWTVGGNVLVSELDGGVALYRGPHPVPELVLPPAGAGD